MVMSPPLLPQPKNLGDSVEIRIRDSGTGIPAEVMEKIFNPFFTTKPAGEGTGLGLSLSHDIVVKQHAGSTEGDTRPREFSEFKVILPRMAATSKAGADKCACLFLLLTTNPMWRRCFASNSDATSATAASRWILPNRQTAPLTSSVTRPGH